MSDLDTLIVTFQTQLSDVMETVVKTAMYEVTRLVEDGFMEEVKRRDQEVESLKMQLQWAENKLSDQDEKERKVRRCADCARDDVDMSAAEERPKEQQDGILKERNVKPEGDSAERWTRSSRQEIISASPQATGDPRVTFSSEGISQTQEEENVLPAVDMKEEVLQNLSCSTVHLKGWGGAVDGDMGSEPHSTSEMTEAHPNRTAENTEEMLGTVVKQDQQITAVYGFPEDLEDSQLVADQSHSSPLELDGGWVGLSVKTAGLLQNHRLAAGKGCDPAKTRGSLKHSKHKLSDSVPTDVHAQVTPGRDQIASPGSPTVRLQNSSDLGVTIKQEVIVDSDGCEESGGTEKSMNSSVGSFSCSVKQTLDTHKQNLIPNEAAVRDVMKPRSKVSTGLRLQAAIQHLHRPMKRPPHPLSGSTTAALSTAHSPAVSRIPSTSKAAAALSLSGQRVHLGDKQTAALSQNNAPWASIKTQHESANSHHATPVPHPDSHSHAGPRHILRCGQCGKCFPHPSNLKAHLQTHTGERPFCCSLCGRSFTKLSNLKAHRRVHTGERPYCCLACGKRFTQKCNLKRHQRIHLDV